MEKGIKTRICINCEGSMGMEDPFCPYCGQNQEAPPANRDKFTPPYKLVQPAKAEIPQPLYKPQGTKPTIKPEEQLKSQVESIHKKMEESKPVEEASAPLTQNAKMRSFLIALILTMCGSTFLLFGLSLFLFGQGGVLTVHWKSTHWYLYMLSSLPLIFFGWKNSNKLAEDV